MTLKNGGKSLTWNRPTTPLDNIQWETFHPKNFGYGLALYRTLHLYTDTVTIRKCKTTRASYGSTFVMPQKLNLRSVTTVMLLRLCVPIRDFYSCHGHNHSRFLAISQNVTTFWMKLSHVNSFIVVAYICILYYDLNNRKVKKTVFFAFKIHWYNPWYICFDFLYLF